MFTFFILYPFQSKFKTKIGRFTLREESEKDEISIGSYFTKKSHITPNTGTTSLAASARDATSKILSGVVSSPASSSSTKTTHPTSFTPKRDYSANSKQEKKEQSFSVAERNSGQVKRVPNEVSLFFIWAASKSPSSSFFMIIIRHHPYYHHLIITHLHRPHQIVISCCYSFSFCMFTLAFLPKNDFAILFLTVI